MQSLLGLLGVAIGDTSGPVGITCTPIDDPANAPAGTQVLDCTNGDTSFNGLVVTGCTPVDPES